MLEVFKDEIPELDKLVDLIRQMVADPKYDLEDIREAVRDHIIEYKEIDPADEEKLGEADCTAYNVIDNLIDELEESEANYERIRDYIRSYHSYNGFNRLIVEFGGFMTDSERRALIEEGKRIFVSELTQHWE